MTATLLLYGVQYIWLNYFSDDYILNKVLKHYKVWHTNFLGKGIYYYQEFHITFNKLKKILPQLVNQMCQE